MTMKKKLGYGVRDLAAGCSAHGWHAKDTRYSNLEFTALTDFPLTDSLLARSSVATGPPIWSAGLAETSPSGAPTPYLEMTA